MYGIEIGQIYISADGSYHGHLVTAIRYHEGGAEVTTLPFTSAGWATLPHSIDAFKLARVRYYLPDPIPNWVPKKEQA